MENLGGWNKMQNSERRRAFVLMSRDTKLSKYEKYLNASEVLKKLADTTDDKITKTVAELDADYFFKMAEQEKNKFKTGGMAKEIGINWQSDFSSDDRDVIEEDIHGHVAHMVREGYRQGQLTSGGTEPSYLGWWKVFIEEDDNDEDIRSEEVANKIEEGFTSGHYPTFTFSANVWSEEFKTGGTTGNKNWFQKAIAETGSLNLGGWKKTQGPTVRRGHAYFSHKVDGKSEHDIALSTARALQALANVTQDKETKKKAKSDANYFFKQAKETKKKKVGMNSRGGMYHGGGDVPAHKYVYRSYEERGHLTASVESIPDGKYVWEYDSENEEFGSPVDDGFMKHWEDIEGLERYLTDLKIIPNDAEILSEPDAQKRYDYYKRGGTTSSAYTLYDDVGEKILDNVTEKEFIDWIEGTFTYDMWDNEVDYETLQNNLTDAIASLEKDGYRVEKFSKGGATSSAWTKFKKWLGEEI